MENDIVFFLLQKAAPRHEIRAAFSHPSVSGWVYLETTMNKVLKSLLNLTPGVIRTRVGIICQGIDHADGMKLLSSQPPGGAPRIDAWVEVRRGIYKGDTGFVTSVNNEEVRLLLVPRLLPPPAKGKASAIPPRNLFDSTNIQPMYGIEPLHIEDNIYSFRGDRFEYGLTTKSYPFGLVSTAVTSMPLQLFRLFLASGHPRLGPLLRPTEWQFAVDDKVYVVDSIGNTSSSSPRGVISTLSKASVEVTTVEGDIHIITWPSLCKDLVLGEFVEVTGGVNQGRTGWIHEVRDSSAHVFELRDNPTSPYHIEVCPKKLKPYNLDIIFRVSQNMSIC